MDDIARREADARLKRIAGQVSGLQRMLASDRYCVDVLLQVAAVRAALAEVGRVVLASHVRSCLTDALRTGGSRERQAKLDELMEVFSRYCGLGTASEPLGRAPRKRK